VPERYEMLAEQCEMLIEWHEDLDGAARVGRGAACEGRGMGRGDLA
jgi:hypothetical protein